MAFFNGYSFQEIHKRTRLLSSVGIFTNKWFMIFYFSFIVSLALMFTLVVMLDLWSRNIADIDEATQLRFNISIQVNRCCATICFLALHIMMLLLY